MRVCILLLAFVFTINPLKTGKTNPDILTISEDPDEMPHRAAFHQGLHYLLRQNRSSRNNTMISEIISCDPSMYTMDHPYLIVYEPVHEISNNVICATSKVSDQPAHTRSLIRAFASNLSNS